MLADPQLRAAAGRLGDQIVRSVVAVTLDHIRAGRLTPEQAVAVSLAALPANSCRLRRVINATGVIVHTNLGRAPLSAAAIDAVLTAAGYTDVEFDLGHGRRAPRGESAVAALRAAVPDAAAVHVVNNNAAALALIMQTFAVGKEVLISRGEFVEIGDGFRIHELLAATGAHLREVGATNRTQLADYTNAITPETALILRVHPSNFVITGFTSSVPTHQLARLSVPVLFDVGSGLLTPHALLPDEPDVTTALRDGAALVTASGDKLLGGPQAGLIFGRAELVERIRRHPLARAVRVDKLTLAALEATVSGPPSPVGSALRTRYGDVRARARDLATQLQAVGIDAGVVDSQASIGGGSAPGVHLPSAAITLPEHFARLLRLGDPAVVGRVGDGRCLLDLRTVPARDDERLSDLIRHAAGVEPTCM